MTLQNVIIKIAEMRQRVVGFIVLGKEDRVVPVCVGFTLRTKRVKLRVASYDIFHRLHRIGCCDVARKNDAVCPERRQSKSKLAELDFLKNKIGSR